MLCAVPPVCALDEPRAAFSLDPLSTAGMSIYWGECAKCRSDDEAAPRASCQMPPCQRWYSMCGVEDLPSPSISTLPGIETTVS